MAANGSTWYQKNKRKNELYWTQVRAAIAGFSRATINSLAAATYEAAVRTTWQDSGRAAHNWNMAAGTIVSNLDVDPTRKFPPDYKRREKRSEYGEEGDVIEERLKEYEIRVSVDGLAVSDWVTEQIGSPVERASYGVFTGFAKAKYPTVTIYNPIGKNFGPYPANAFELHRNVRKAMDAAQTKQFSALHQNLNKGKKSPEELIAYVNQVYSIR